MGANLLAGLVFGDLVVLGEGFEGAATPVALDREVGTLLSVFLSNSAFAVVMAAGSLTGGLVSVLVAVSLGTGLGLETALILQVIESPIEMVVITGPHAVFELGGFVMGLSAGLFPLTSAVLRTDGLVGESEGPSASVSLGVVKRVMLSIGFLAIAAFIEVYGAIGV